MILKLSALGSKNKLLNSEAKRTSVYENMKIKF